MTTQVLAHALKWTGDVAAANSAICEDFCARVSRHAASKLLKVSIAFSVESFNILCFLLLKVSVDFVFVLFLFLFFVS